MTKFDKKDLKNPDIVTQELKKGFEWTTQHSKTVITTIVVLAALGGGYSAYTSMQDKKEREIQEVYYKVEKDYLEKKAKFDQFEQESKKPKDLKAKKDTAEPTPQGIKASGNFDEDYGTIATSFWEVINKAPKSQAAKMAALHLSDINSQYKRSNEAIAVLTKVDTKSTDLLSAMILSQLGSRIADENNCKEALKFWDMVTAKKEYKFMHSSVMLNQGLCYENLGDVAKADETYAKIEKDFKDSGVAKTAEKYRRLLKAKSAQ